MSSQYFAAMREDLEEARRWGDLKEIARLEEEIREKEDYMDHCHEKQWEAQREDARMEAYWEQFDA
jgi:hypothetical protein